jgi:antagonist of KipI
MKRIQVQTPGLLTTVQDLGREGFGPMGISPSGAADPIASRLGNRLVGNPENAAALEMTLLGGEFLFPEGGIIALTGSDFGATLNGAPDACRAAGLWTSIEVGPGEILRCGPTLSGARCYLCVQGGIDVTPFLGSASTQLLSGLGGFNGRPLRKGDILETGASSGVFQRRTVAPMILDRLAPRKTLRVTAGPQADWFPEPVRAAFFESAFRVTEEANRMGLRLERLGSGGPAVTASHAGQMITEGVSLGAIQVPPGGQPIILFVEQQTTGGYPKIANVISADLSSVGQLRPRDEIRFEVVSLETAVSILAEQELLLRQAV